MSTWNLKLGELEKLREQNAELKRVLMQAFDQAIEHKHIAATFIVAGVTICISIWHDEVDGLLGQT